MKEKTEDTFGAWMIVELLGHVKLAGYVTEEELFGTKVGRIDIPGDEDGEAGVTQYFAGQSIYRLTPVTESTARAYAQNHRPRPVQRWELPAPEKSPFVDQEQMYQAMEEEEGGPFDPTYDDDLPLEEDYDF
jgi:hypothetical protein